MPTATPRPPGELRPAGTGTAAGAGAGAGAGRARSRVPSALPRGLGVLAGRIATLTVGQAALLVGVGLLITGPARDVWPLTVEDEINESFEAARTGTLTTVSAVASEAGNTLTVVGITLLVCLGLVLIPRLPMWRQTAFLAGGVSLQALVFLCISTVVDRGRPDVEKLDDSPPTASYTSGHTGAATAVYAGLAVLVLSRMRRGPWRVVVAGLLLLIPLLVAVARLYRGMHHPTDVLGGLVNGGLSLLIVGRALLAEKTVVARPVTHAGRAAMIPAPAGGEADRDAVGTPGAGPGTTAVIVNPTVAGADEREALRRVLERHGHRDPRFHETTAEDPGAGQTAHALRDGARLVVVCGGDGTVRAAADALAGSGVPLAVVPCGTGNLLARNLGLPLAPAESLDAALRGAPHLVDLGRVEGDGLAATHFAAMAGAGLDAAMLEQTGDRAKSVVGWPAYVLAGLGTLRTPRARVTIRLDGGSALRRTARMVLVGNIGTVQGGVTLLPGARPDDGLLDLLVLDPRGPGGWARAVGMLLRGTGSAKHTPRPTTLDAGGAGGAGGAAAAHGVDGVGEAGRGRGSVPVEHFTFRRAEFTFEDPQARELDGDPVAHGRRLTAEVAPGALTVLLPTEPDPDPDARRPDPDPAPDPDPDPDPEPGV